MKFKAPLIEGILIKRYKRFLADMELPSGDVITVHTANSGSMKGLLEAGNPVYLSYHDVPTRRLKHSWEIVTVQGINVGINTSLPNLLVAEAIQNGTIQELAGYPSLRREVKYGQNSRIDLLLEAPEKPVCYVEVKNVTLLKEGVACFPDAVSERGTKHLRELMAMVDEGHRAVMVYVVQRIDARAVVPADDIDPVYGETLRKALKHGVEAVAYRAQVTPEEILLTKRLPVEL